MPIPLPMHAISDAAVRHLTGCHDGASPLRLHVDRRALRGGLAAESVERVTVRYHDDRGRARRGALIVKRLVGPAAREAVVYERFVAPQAGELSPRLLAVDRQPSGDAALYLEALRPVRAWPWRERRAAESVLQRAAWLHARVPSLEATSALAAWDYEAELQYASTLTLERLEQVRRRPAFWSLHGGLRWARRVVGALPALRRRLLAFAPLGSAVVHGDLHPGNVVLRVRRGRPEPVLLDWGRARIGSPLEDVSCWLHSLGTWEPAARRRHDSLLAGYLALRGLELRLDAELRAVYWLAGASNALSGALLHHLGVLLDDGTSSATRGRAAHAAREWLRVLRRTDAYWS